MIKSIFKIDFNRSKNNFIKYILNNRLEYEYFQKYKKNNNIRSIVLNKFQKQEETLNNFNKLLNRHKIKFFYFKTFKNQKYIFSDIDVYVYDNYLEKIIKILKKEKYNIMYYEPKGQYSVYKNNLCFDLHTNFNRNNIKIHISKPYDLTYNRKMLLLNRKDDFFLNILNVLLEKFHLNYIDYDYLNKIFIDEGNVLFSNFKDNNFIYLHEIFVDELSSINKDEILLPKIIKYKNFIKIIIKTLFLHKKIMLFEIFYYHFSLIRYLVTNKKYLPVFKKSWLEIE